jgi:hypothetical protein
MIDGFFFDEQTHEIKVSMIFYNSVYSHFTTVVNTFEFRPGGTVGMTPTVRNFNGAPYQTTSDFTRFILEMVFLALVISQASP